MDDCATPREKAIDLMKHRDEGEFYNQGEICEVLQDCVEEIHRWESGQYARQSDVNRINQIDQLANFIMAEVDGEPSENEGAVECAIRIMKEQKHTIDFLKERRKIGQKNNREKIFFNKR